MKMELNMMKRIPHHLISGPHITTTIKTIFLLVVLEMQSFSLFVIICLVQCAKFNVIANVHDMSIPSIALIQYWNQSKAMIYAQHEIFLQNIHQWDQNENYKKEIKWYVYGLIILSGNNDYDLGYKNSVTIDEAIQLHSSDVLMIGIKLQHLGEKLLKLGFHHEAVYIYEVCRHVLSLGQRSDIRSFQLTILMALGDLYSSQRRFDDLMSIYTDIASILDETNHQHSTLAAHVSVKRAAVLCELGSINETNTDCLMIANYVNATLIEPTDLAHVFNLSARVNIAHNNYEIAEKELRECVKILSTQSHMNESNQESLSVILNLANIYFAQSKWFDGANTLEKCLHSYAQILRSPQEKTYLHRLIKRAIGAYSQASIVFNSTRRYQESKLSRERAVKMTSDWRLWLLQFNSSNEIRCDEKNNLPPVPPNPISKNFPKNTMKNQSEDPLSHNRHVLDTLVFWTVILILLSSGLYSISGVSHTSLAAMNTMPKSPTIHSTLQFKSP
jgi:tetratricopeptide (TPR) repeat protein